MPGTVATVAGYAARVLKMVREKIEMDREYTAEEVADFVAFSLDGAFSEPMNAHLSAETDGDKIMLIVYPHDEENDETSPKGQVFTITVTDGYAMGLEPDNDDDFYASWGERS
jgi:hypothetical protein